MEKRPQITIGELYTTKHDDKTRLCAMVNMDGNDREVWLEVDNEYAQYLCYERSDAFLTIFLHHAMKYGYDINLKTPVTAQLFFKVKNFFIPALCEGTKEFTHIEINCSCETEIIENCMGGVGTGLSCGADSLYTVKRFSDCFDASFNITHFTYFFLGSNGYKGQDRELGRKRVEWVEQYAKKVDVPLIVVDSNLPEYFDNHDYMGNVTYKCMAAVMALQKLFKYYYFSSAYEINDFHISADHAEYYDFLTAQCLSYGNLTFESTGIGWDRNAKLE